MTQTISLFYGFTFEGYSVVYNLPGFYDFIVHLIFMGK